MTTIVNAAGGDYTGLPTQPVRYRSRPQHTGLDWNALTENYTARGGQVDASVWPKVGNVAIIGGSANSSRANIHTFEEADPDNFDYGNNLANTAPQKQRRTTRHFSDEQCRAIALKYRDQQASIRDLADEYGVSISAIRTALRFTGEQTRSRSETNRLRARSTS